MKKKVLLGILAVTLIFGMAVIGCDGDGENGDGNGNGGNDNPYVGSAWIGLAGDQSRIILSLSDLTFEITSDDNWRQKGTYTYNENTVTLKLTHVKIGENDWTTNPNGNFGLESLPQNYTLTLTGNQLSGNGTTLTKPGKLKINNFGSNIAKVKISTVPITGNTNFEASEGIVAEGQGVFPYLLNNMFAWTGTGSYNVMLRLTTSPNTIKYQNNVDFTNGNGEVDWNTMTTIQ